MEDAENRFPPEPPRLDSPLWAIRERFVELALEIQNAEAATSRRGGEGNRAAGNVLLALNHLEQSYGWVRSAFH